MTAPNVGSELVESHLSTLLFLTCNLAYNEHDQFNDMLNYIPLNTRGFCLKDYFFLECHNFKSNYFLISFSKCPANSIRASLEM